MAAEALRRPVALLCIDNDFPLETQAKIRPVDERGEGGLRHHGDKPSACPVFHLRPVAVDEIVRIVAGQLHGAPIL